MRFPGSGLRRTVARARRYRHILAVLARYGLEDLVDILQRRVADRFGRRAVPTYVRRLSPDRPRTVRVRLALEELGPTFIKLGQLLSTRPDLIPADYVAELERLQDRVPPEKPGTIQAAVEEELGKTLGKVFTAFDPEPVGAGSIAQVHRARTVDGRDVVVKVRRPGVVDIIRVECEILHNLAGMLKSRMDERDMIDPVEVVREFTAAIEKEVDLGHERQNQLRFAAHFADEPNIHVPAVYRDLCTDALLTMEYIDGVKAVSAAALKERGLDPKAIAETGVNFIMRQIFDTGFFHTDPHPGNFLLTDGNVLVPLDFGQVATLTERDRDMVSDIMMAIVDDDAAAIIGVFRRNEIIDHGDPDGRLASDIRELMDIYRNQPLKDIPFQRVISRCFQLLRKHRVHPPLQFTMMLKSMMTAESVATMLDEEFQIIAYIKPYAQKIAFRRLDPRRLTRNLRDFGKQLTDLATHAPEDINEVLKKAREGRVQIRVHHEHLENLSDTIDKSSNRISFALIIAALLVASSMLVGQDKSILGVVNMQTLGVAGYIVATIIGLWLTLSILRGRKW